MLGARAWVAGFLAVMALLAGGLWLFWPQDGVQTETTGCVARTPGIVEAAAHYNAYLREHCGPDGADGGNTPAK